MKSLDFTKIILGYNEIDDFTRLAIREKFITSFSDEWDEWDSGDFDDDFFEAQHSRISNKSSLLRTLLLFENIDSNRFVKYNCDRLIERGIVTENSLICAQGKGNELSPEHKINDKINYEDEQGFSYLLTGLIIKMDNKLNTSFFGSIDETEIKKIAHLLSKGNIKEAKNLLLNSELTGLFANEIIGTDWFDSFLYSSGIISKSFGIIDRQALRFAKANICRFILNPITSFLQKNRDIFSYSSDAIVNNCVELLDKLFVIDGKLRCINCEMRRSIECLDKFNCEHSFDRYVTLIDIFTSLEEKIPVYSRSFKTTAVSSINEAKIVNDVYYLFRLSELKQLNSLPTPQSLEEMLRLRSRPEIISFRRVFRTWCEQLQNFGDEKAIQLITKDFNRASEYLKKQYEHEQRERERKPFIQNLFSIILEIPGLFIPFFSLLFDLPKPWIKRSRAIKKHEVEWFLLTREG